MKTMNACRSWAAVLPLALLLALPLAQARSADARSADTSAAYERAIAARELSEGPLAPGLVEDLLGLAAIHQREGRHAEALRAYERARYISRAQSGLYSEEQVLILGRVIDSLESTGEWLRAGEQHEALLHLQRRVYGPHDPRMASALLRAGEWHLAVFERGLRHQPLGSPAGTLRGPASQKESFAFLQQAQKHFVTAIRLLLDQQAYGHPDLFALEQGLIDTYRLQAQREALLADPDAPPRPGHPALGGKVPDLEALRRQTADFRGGESAYQRMLGYLEARAAPAEHYAEVLHGMAEWYRLFGHDGEARERYDQARRLRAASAVSSPGPLSLLRQDGESAGTQY